MNKPLSRYLHTAALLILAHVVLGQTERFDRELEGVANDIALEIAAGNIKTVAVADFTDLQGTVTDTGRFVAEELSAIVVMTNKKVAVVDRANLKRIMDEHKLTAAGLVDPSNAKKLGDLSGADAIITGSVTPFESINRLVIKVIATDTARIVAAAHANLPKSFASADAPSTDPTSAEPESKQQKRNSDPGMSDAMPTRLNAFSDARVPRQKLENFVVEVSRAQTSSDGGVVIYLRFTSVVNARLKMLLAAGFLGDGKTFLMDDAGQRYDLTNSSGIGKCCYGFAGGDWQGAVLDLPPKGNVDVTLTFRHRGNTFEPEPERMPQGLNLTAELTTGEVVRLRDWGQQWQSRGSAGISIAGINPR